MTPEEFKAARQKLGLTQSQLGRILDTAPQTIRKWEMPDTASTTMRRAASWVRNQSSRVQAAAGGTGAS